MVEDVRLALNGVRPVEFFNRTGGNVPSHEQVLELVRDLAKRYLPAAAQKTNDAVKQDKERMAHV